MIMLLLLRPLLSLYLTCALLLHVETVESEQYIPSTSISVEQCLNSSVADGFYLISSTRPLGQITMGDQLLFLMARMVEHKKSLCENVEARSRGDSILQSFVSTGKKFVVASDAAVVQSIYSRVMVVGRQYGTDQNDGTISYLISSCHLTSPHRTLLHLISSHFISSYLISRYLLFYFPLRRSYVRILSRLQGIRLSC